MSLRADHLFKCRVVVARLGEMDRAGARWWNTAGLLSSVGVSALKRNFPYTHWFAQARAVIAVAGARSSEVFPLPKSCVSLWSFPPDVEVRLSEEWPQWIANETDLHVGRRKWVGVGADFGVGRARVVVPRSMPITYCGRCVFLLNFNFRRGDNRGVLLRRQVRKIHVVFREVRSFGKLFVAQQFMIGQQIQAHQQRIPRECRKQLVRELP